MKISVQKEDIIKGIQTVQNAVSTRGSLPILANILLETREDKLSLTATDLDIAISRVIPAKVSQSGSVTVPAKRFGDIIKELWSDDPIKIHAGKNATVQIEVKKNYFKIPGLPKDDFPQIPLFVEDKNSISVSRSALSEMIRMTQFAMSRDEARYVLNGTLFVFDKKLFRLVATDGRRLAMIDREVGQSVSPKKQVIVPTKSIQEINRNIDGEGEIKIHFKENQLQFEIDDILITSRLIEGEFPNYEQVIPQKTKEKVEFFTQDFLSAVKRASVFTNQDSQSIKLSLEEGRTVISKNAPEVGEAYEEIVVGYRGNEMSIGFNPAYLIDVLKNVGEDKFLFEFIDPEKPGLIRTDQRYTYIVLPMQLTS